MNQSDEALFERIRTKCQQEQWFGPDFLGPRRRYAQYIATDAPERFGFVFPPATQEQLHQTEQEFGFPLPPLLRVLYEQIANGGFGPGTGLRGAIDGYGKPGTGIYPDDDDTIAAQYRFRSHKQTIQLTEYVKQKVGQEPCIHLKLPYGVWPEHLLPICDMGCVQEACVDSQQRVYVGSPTENPELYGLVRLPWTFEEWLWRWVRDEEPDVMSWSEYEYIV